LEHFSKKSKFRLPRIEIAIFEVLNLLHMICTDPHRYDSDFDVLPESQANSEGRHKCAGCAYDQGYSDGLARVEPNFDAEDLPYSQAGVVRHKSPHAAYNMGYADGMRQLARP